MVGSIFLEEHISISHLSTDKLSTYFAQLNSACRQENNPEISCKKHIQNCVGPDGIPGVAKCRFKEEETDIWWWVKSMEGRPQRQPGVNPPLVPVTL